MTNLPVAGAYTGAFRDPGRRRHRANGGGGRSAKVTGLSDQARSVQE